MGQPSFPADQKYEIERLWKAVGELNRKRPRRQPNLRDLQDVNGWGTLNGYIFTYDTATGRHRPVVPPPFVTFNRNGALAVAGFDKLRVPAPIKLFLGSGYLTTAGTATSTALLKKNSTTVATYTFTSGNNDPTSQPALSTSYAAGDTLWVDVTAAGTSAAGLVIAVWAMADIAPV